MKIYIAHSKLINYIDELYKPIKEMNIYKNHEIFFLMKMTLILIIQEIFIEQ